MDINAIIGRLKGLLEKATPGEWKSRRGDKYGDNRVVPVFSGEEAHGWSAGFYSEPSDEDADFIAFAHNHLPAVLAELSRLRAELDRERKRAEGAEADLKAFADGARLKPDDAQVAMCFACKWDEASDCPGVEADTCFEWRGVTSTST
jgi:hypothetical protein